MDGRANLVKPDEDDSTDSSRKDEERVIWDNKAQYILSLIGFAVGVGNVWRFPYLCQRYGGGAFLIPYAIMLFVEGLPLFYLELSLGHRFHSGTIGTWRQIAPASIGIGIAMSIISSITNCYYIIVMAWSFFYFFNSFRDPLPWMTCDGVTGTTLVNGTVVNVSDFCNNGSTKFYWYNTAVQASSSINEPGTMVWELALCLILSWVTVFVCMVKGVKSSGKAVYVTATFPFVILITLFFRGVTLKGAGKGVAFLFSPNFSILYDPIVWLEASGQIFYSLCVGFGALITYTSYVDPNKKATPLRDSLTVSFINCGTSLFASIVVFAVLGFKADYFGVDLEDVASGPGLSFIAFSEALGHMPGGPFWSVLFFLMLIMLALDSVFGCIEVPLTDILDELGPRWQFLTKFRILLLLCVSHLVVGFVFVIQSGFYSFQLFNTFSGSLPLITIALCECLAVCWLYGAERFAHDMEAVTGAYPKKVWLYMWKYVSPLVLAVIVIGSIIKQGIDPLNYTIYQNYVESNLGEYPPWALLCAAFLILISIVPIFVVAFRYYARRWIVRKSYSVQTRGIAMEEIAGGAAPSYRSLENMSSDSEVPS